MDFVSNKENLKDIFFIYKSYLQFDTELFVNTHAYIIASIVNILQILIETFFWLPNTLLGVILYGILREV